MAYSQKDFPNDPEAFPAPPAWCVWVANYDYRIKMPMIDGKIRHYPDTPQDLTKLKGHIRDYCKEYDQETRAYTGRFSRAWAAYRWDSALDRYVLVYQGSPGESIKDNPLFQRKPSTKPRRNKQKEAVALIHEAIERQAQRVS
jgi:hypothetical protein